MDGPEMPGDNVMWNEEDNVPVDELVERSIVSIEEKFLDNYGWDSLPVILGVVYLSTLAGMGSVSVQLLSDLPDAVQEEPVPGFPFMVDMMVNDVAHNDEDIEWLDEIVTRPGFMGWIVVLTGLTDEEQKVRNVLYYSRSQGIFTAHRVEGSEPEFSWAPEQFLCEHSQIGQTVVKLNEISHYVRLKSWLRSSAQ